LAARPVELTEIPPTNQNRSVSNRHHSQGSESVDLVALQSVRSITSDISDCRGFCGPQKRL
jgi:hypothetical protein